MHSPLWMIEVANCELTHALFDGPVNDVLAEVVKQVVLASEDFLGAFNARFDGPFSPSFW